MEIANSVSAVDRLLPAGARLFVTPYHSLVNFWTLRSNPTRYDHFTIHTDEQRQEIIDDVEAAGACVLAFGPADVLSLHFLRSYSMVWRDSAATLLCPGDFVNAQ